MRSTEMNARLNGVSASEAFDRLADFGSYAELAPSINSIEIEKVDERTLRTTWNVNFRGGSMRWVEEDRLDPEAGTIVFDLVEGNLRHFSGSWAVTEAERPERHTLPLRLRRRIPGAVLVPRSARRALPSGTTSRRS